MERSWRLPIVEGEQIQPRRCSMRTSFIAVALLAVALFIGGYAVGQVRGVSGTLAAGSTTTPTPSTNAGPPPFPAPGSAAHEDAEKDVTGSAASKAQAAAVNYVGSGTAGSVTTDFGGDGYEVTVTKPDGSSVEVHLDSSFTVRAGHGDHGGPFGPPSSGTSGGGSA
jgi:hypothetical protein